MTRSTSCVNHPNRKATHLRMRPAYWGADPKKKYQFVCDECTDALAKKKLDQRKYTLLGPKPVGVIVKPTNVFSQLQNASTILEEIDEAAQKAKKSA